MSTPPMSPDDILALLEGNAGRIATLTAALSPAQLRTRPASDE